MGYSKALALVACSKGKDTSPNSIRARDLYTSQLFTKAATYVQADYESWFILSAHYGLLDPAAIVQPYEKTLNNTPRAERVEWALGVEKSLVRLLPITEVHIFAGARYREFLIPRLEARGIKVEVPLLGMGIGQQLAWYTQRTKGE